MKKSTKKKVKTVKKNAARTSKVVKRKLCGKKGVNSRTHGEH